MRYCCVPFCTTSKDKPVGISFHEFPSNLELYKKWLKAIARKDWIPSSDGRSVVCSRHFLPEDYSPSLKRKYLKIGTVPSVFHGYPKYMQKKIKPPRSTSAIQKRDEFSKSIRKPDPKVIEKQAVIVVVPPEEPVPRTRDVATRVDIRILKKLKTRDFSAQADFIKAKQMVEVKRWKRKTGVLEKKIKKLEDRLKAYKENDVGLDKFRKVIDAGRDKDPYAIFIMDQVHNFGVKRARWSEATVSECNYLRNVSFRGYSRARRLFRLPNINTLKRHKNRHIEEVLTAVSAANPEPTVDPIPVQAQQTNATVNVNATLQDHCYLALQPDQCAINEFSDVPTTVDIDNASQIFELQDTDECMVLEAIESANEEHVFTASNHTYCSLTSDQTVGNKVLTDIQNNSMYVVLNPWTISNFNTPL